MEILDYDPISKLTTYAKHEDGRMVVYTEEDVEAQLEAAKELRNTDSRKARYSGLMDAEHYAHIPDTFIMKWLSEGFNVYSPDVTFAEINSMINRDCPHFKLTTMNHDRYSRWL